MEVNQMEIGSEFDLNLDTLQESEDNIFKFLNGYNCVFTDSGRSAIMLLDRMLPPGEILLPDYICASVINGFSIHSVNFYTIDADFRLSIQSLIGKITSQTKAVFLVNYFGILQREETIIELERLRTMGIVVIEDTTHSIFTQIHSVGDFCIASLRKWFRVPDGGVLYSKKKIDIVQMSYVQNTNIADKTSAMVLKNLKLRNILDCNEVYRKLFVASEHILDEMQCPKLISDFSRFLLSCYDISDIKRKRKKNFQTLYARLPRQLTPIILKDITGFCPFSLPVFVEKRDDFRKHLIDNQIYCAVHWPVIGTVLEINFNAVEISSHILSLPIDQRYSEYEMEYLAEIVGKFWE